MTPKPFQSKLRPHLEFIRECLMNEMSYPRIAAEMRARFGLSVAPSTIFAFVKVRSRRRDVITLLAPDAAQPRSVAPARNPAPTATAPVTTAPSAAWGFYDPDKPLERLTS